VVSAVFHYLGPAFAVLLFAHLDVLGVAWLRIAGAAALFAVWRRPWRLLTGMNRRGRVLLGQLGAVLAAMNVLSTSRSPSAAWPPSTTYASPGSRSGSRSPSATARCSYSMWSLGTGSPTPMPVPAP
jgi:hypothetical protein